MRPLYDARISDLGPGDRVLVECACGHAEMLTAAMLATAGLEPYRKVLDLGARMRCRDWDERGRVVVSFAGGRPGATSRSLAYWGRRWWWKRREGILHRPRLKEIFKHRAPVSIQYCGRTSRINTDMRIHLIDSLTFKTLEVTESCNV